METRWALCTEHQALIFQFYLMYPNYKLCVISAVRSTRTSIQQMERDEIRLFSVIQIYMH